MFKRFANRRHTLNVGGTRWDVTQAYRLKVNTEDFFLLVQAQGNEAFSDSEIAGLHAFEAAGIRAPKVIASGRQSPLIDSSPFFDDREFDISRRQSSAVSTKTFTTPLKLLSHRIWLARVHQILPALLGDGPLR